MRILIVDDEPRSGRALKAVLSARGHRVMTCTDALEARRLAACEPPEVVVVDYWLAEEPGVDLLRSLRLQAPRARCLVLTGDPSVVLPPELADVPLKPKPCSLEVLLAWLEHPADAERKASPRPPTGPSRRA